MADVSKITLPDSSEYNLKDATVRTALAGGTTGQILKKKSNSDFDVEWGAESGAVLSVNGQTGNVSVPTVAVQDSAPTDTNCKLWIDTDETGTSYSLPQIDDNSVNSYDTWSSQKIRDFIYPVGSIYLSVNSTSPATIFGGTWEQIEDRFLLAAGTTYTAGATGGEATHKLTTTEMPSHTHYIYGGNGDPPDWFGGSGNAYGIKQRTGSAYDYLQYVGGNGAHNNMPPYLVVYIWKRTA